MSRRICVELYREIVKLRPEWHSDDDAAGVVKVVMTGGTHAALSVLTAHPESLSPGFITAALTDMGCGSVRYTEIGGHTAPFSVTA
jgi:hypothetical protein